MTEKSTQIDLLDRIEEELEENVFTENNLFGEDDDLIRIDLVLQALQKIRKSL